MVLFVGPKIFRVFPLRRTGVRFVNAPAKTPRDAVANSDEYVNSKNIVRLDFKDDKISKAMLQVKSKKTREKSGLILLEGKRLIQDYIDSGNSLEMVFFSRTKDLDGLNFDSSKGFDTKLFKCSYKDLQLWSSVVTSPGLLAIARKPQLMVPAKDSLPVAIVCDQIREPGNLGTLIRVGAGAGVNKVILTKGCCDPWDSKTLRAGTGAHFKLPLFEDVDWADIDELVRNQPATRLYLGTNKFIPGIPLKDYSTVDFSASGGPILLVIGGETLGLSQNAVDLAVKIKGEAVSIALSNNIDSLNSVSAAAVLLFELRKQYMMSSKT